MPNSILYIFLVSGPSFIILPTKSKNNKPSNKYNSIKPSNLKSVLPEENVGEAPSAVRNKLYTSKGCLPNSAVYQPVEFAIYGKAS